MELFNNLDPLLRTFWYIAIPASVIFIIQTIMTFVGADASDGLDADFDGDMSTDGHDAPFQLFSFRNLINFLLGLGWAGVSLYDSITNHTLLIIVSLLVGCAFVYGFFLIIKQLTKLAEDNTFKVENTLNKNAEVYLTIPGQKSGTGKVLISVKGSMHELQAMTEHERIETGKMVKVVKLENNILIVETI